jgi:hypothetical protein
MSNRLARIGLSAVVGSAGIAIGLYAGYFAALGSQLLRNLTGGAQLSREMVALVADVTRWLFLGLMIGLGLSLTAVTRRRILFGVASIVGFGLGGALASWLVASNPNRSVAPATLAVPLGGALAGLLIGLSAQLRTRAALMLIIGAIAMAIGGPLIDPRTSVVLPPPWRLALSEWIALLAPGAIIGIALAALAPEREESPPPA